MKTVETHHQRAPAEPGVCSRCCPAESLRVQSGGRGRRSFSRSKEVRTFASSDAPSGPRAHASSCQFTSTTARHSRAGDLPTRSIHSEEKRKCVYLKKTSCLRGEVSHMALQRERSSTGRPDLCFPTGCSLKKPTKSSPARFPSLPLSLQLFFSPRTSGHSFLQTVTVC